MRRMFFRSHAFAHFNRLSQLREETGRSWILAIVRNTAYTWLRKNRSGSFVFVEDLTEHERIDAELGGKDENPETQLIERVDAARFETAIKELPSQFREVLVLRDMQVPTGHVRFTPESGHVRRKIEMSAKGQKRT
jgi:RNA polymerase sigma factor (sigma-70 family)